MAPLSIENLIRKPLDAGPKESTLDVIDRRIFGGHLDLVPAAIGASGAGNVVAGASQKIVQSIPKALRFGNKAAGEVFKLYGRLFSRQPILTTIGTAAGAEAIKNEDFREGAQNLAEYAGKAGRKLVETAKDNPGLVAAGIGTALLVKNLGRLRGISSGTAGSPTATSPAGLAPVIAATDTPVQPQKPIKITVRPVINVRNRNINKPIYILGQNAFAISPGEK